MCWVNPSKKQVISDFADFDRKPIAQESATCVFIFLLYLIAVRCLYQTELYRRGAGTFLKYTRYILLLQQKRVDEYSILTLSFLL